MRRRIVKTAVLSVIILMIGPFFLQPNLSSAKSGIQIGKAQSSTIKAADLPAEARHTLKLIKQGRPFPFPKDGVIFGNREGHLPAKPRGYYREYTVKTPGERSRGARRIVSGSGGEFYYTDDHYNTFRVIEQ